MIGSELYQIAKKYLGKGGATFRKFCGLASNAPYCCAYVCYIFFTNSLNKLFYGGKKVTYCPNAIKWCQANLAQLPLYMAMPMDIAFFDWNKNGIPDHIGFIKAKISSDKIATHEGNTSGGIVAEKTRTVGYMMGGVFRPHYAPKGLKKEVLAVDGDFGYKSVYMLQVMLDVKADGILGKITLKAFQRKLGVAPDASWGRKTTLAAQRLVGVKDDGEWGPVSTRALQTYVNNKCFSSMIDKPSQEELKLKCIDVSYWQGKISVENWKKVKKTCGYAICRASYTSQSSFTLNKDSTFADNFVNAKAAGLKVGAYHYSQAITVDEAKREAEYLCEILKNYDPTFYVVCDFEFGDRLNKNIGTKASDIANAFCDVVKARGYDPCIYANTNTLTNYLKNPKYPVWVAQYNSTCTYKGSKVMWQYISSGSVEGVSGKVDLSYVYTEPTSAPEPTKTTYTGTLPSLRVVKTTAQVISDALKWGKWIAENNKFHYGEYGHPTYKTKDDGKYKPIYNVTHSCGCHFCGTNAARKNKKATKLGYNGDNWEYTWVCNTFVTAMYAHGGQESYCLGRCTKGGAAGLDGNGKSPGLESSKNWVNLGKLAIKDLKAGDVLVSNNHMQCVFAPVSSTKAKIIEATSYVGKYGSAASNKSIRIIEKKPSYVSVYRYIGSINKDLFIKYGEYSDRVTYLQKFLNWAGFNCGTADGIFGDNTLKAVKAFQNSNGLTQDGIVGPKTIEKMKTTRS